MPEMMKDVECGMKFSKTTSSFRGASLPPDRATHRAESCEPRKARGVKEESGPTH